MEKNFNTDNFEQMLREATDDFRMYPPKRVWHGIYNDLHPAKKWPSFAVLLLLVTSIMYIGVTNPDKGKQQVDVISSDESPEQKSSLADNKSFSGTAPQLTVTPTRNTGRGNVGNKVKVNINNQQNNLAVASVQKNQLVDGSLDNIDKPVLALVSGNFSIGNSPSVENVILRSEAMSSLSTQGDKLINASTKKDAFSTSISSIINGSTATSLNTIIPISGNELTIAKPKLSNPSNIGQAENASLVSGKDESGWMEDFALRNLKSGDKWKGRMSYQVYVTPSIGYRRMMKTTDYSLPQTNALVTNPNAPVTKEYSMNHASAINLEIGTTLIYNASKRLRLKAGVQINYTNYSINAHELNHPTFTSLMLTNSLTNAPVLSTRTTTLASTQGPASKYLNNHTYQVSLPLGADLKIAGKDKLKVYLGSTIQPTYVLGGQSYLISADMKNYVAEQDFMRKYNLNGAVEAFITYKTKSGVSLNAGPQFRYQFFSTYTKTYTYDERLYNLGVKFGMTKNF